MNTQSRRFSRQLLHRSTRSHVSPNEALLTAVVLAVATLAPSVPAQLQFDQLRALPVDRDETRDVAMGDVDGDGRKPAENKECYRVTDEKGGAGDEWGMEI